MAKTEVDKAAIVRSIVFLILPLVLMIVAFIVYRQFLFNNRFINKVILRKDMEFNYFTYDEMDSPVGSGDVLLPFYYRDGKKYITGSGKENFNTDTLILLDKARDIVEKGYNKANPKKRVVFVINSAYRTRTRNTEVGGVDNSGHRNKNNEGSKAVDIAWRNYDNDQKRAIRESLEEVGFTRFGIHGGFIHVDNDLSLPNPAVWGY